jgi:hypothetical protein
MARSSTSVDVAVIGAGPHGLRARGVEHRIFGEPMVSWTLAVGIEGACAALVLAFATKLNSAAGPVHEGWAPSPLQT